MKTDLFQSCGLLVGLCLRGNSQAPPSNQKLRRGERGSFILESSDGEGQRGKRRSPRETKFKAPCWRHVPPGRASGGKVSPLGAGREIKNIVYIFYLESRNY